MTARSDEDSSDDDDVSGASIDFDRLDIIEERLATDERFARIEREPQFAPDRLVCVYDTRFYPSTVSVARLEVGWYEDGDFSIHYHEDHDQGELDHRWDRHPSDHNIREHVHPGPDAPTPGDDASHPEDWRDVLSEILTEIEIRQRGFWRE